MLWVVFVFLDRDKTLHILFGFKFLVQHVRLEMCDWIKIIQFNLGPYLEIQSQLLKMLWPWVILDAIIT